MKKQLVATLILILTPALLVSCVSSLLQEKAPTFSSEIKFADPAEPFTKLNKSVYPSWKNKKTGNVISIVSDCSDSSSITLYSLHQIIEGSIDKPKVSQQNTITFKNKPALVHVTEGLLDLEPIEIHSMSFKRNNCGYVTSLSGKPKNLNADKAFYDQFNESLTFE